MSGRPGKNHQAQINVTRPINYGLSVNVPTPRSMNIDEKIRKHASVHMTVDTSGSMRGSKLTQVILSLKEIIQKSPKHVRFIIRTFSDQIDVLVSKQKYRLDLERMESDLRNNTGGRTVLYDAWAQTIRDIPYKSFHTDRIYILIFTDGEDNASTNENLNSVIKLVNEKMDDNVYFTFIQAGPTSPSVRAIQQNCLHKNCQVLSIENSAKGIRIAFDKVYNQIQSLYFEISLSDGFKGLRIQATNTVSATATDKYQKPSNLKLPAAPSCFNSTATTRISNQPRKLNQEKKPKKIFPVDQITKKTAPVVNSLPLPIELSASNASLKLHNCGILVKNIPLSVEPVDLQSVFSQWGNCTVENSGFEKTYQWCLLSYTNRNDATDALIYGDKMNLRGSRLAVQFA